MTVWLNGSALWNNGCTKGFYRRKRRKRRKNQSLHPPLRLRSACKCHLWTLAKLSASSFAAFANAGTADLASARNSPMSHTAWSRTELLGSLGALRSRQDVEISLIF